MLAVHVPTDAVIGTSTLWFISTNTTPVTLCPSPLSFPFCNIGVCCFVTAPPFKLFFFSLLKWLFSETLSQLNSWHTARTAGAAFSKQFDTVLSATFCSEVLKEFCFRHYVYFFMLRIFFPHQYILLSGRIAGQTWRVTLYISKTANFKFS